MLALFRQSAVCSDESFSLIHAIFKIALQSNVQGQQLFRLIHNVRFNMHVIPLYAAVLGLIYVGLSFRTIALRRKQRLSLGDGGDKALNRAIRVHGNFAEYVPIGLILLFLLESQAYSRVLVHIFASMLLAGRILHAYGVSQLKEADFRTTGMLPDLVFDYLLARSS